MAGLLMKNQVARATASLRSARVLALLAALIQLLLLLPVESATRNKLFLLVTVGSGLLGLIAFRITHRAVGETISALRGFDALGIDGRQTRAQTELSLTLVLYFGFFVPLLNLLLLGWTFLKAHLAIGRTEAQFQEAQQRELRAARLRSS